MDSLEDDTAFLYNNYKTGRKSVVTLSLSKGNVAQAYDPPVSTSST